VIGARRTAPATVRLAYRDGRAWRVVAASYEGADGRAVSLFDPYAEAAALDEQTDTAAPVAGFDEEGFKTSVLEADGLVLVFLGSPSSLDSRAVEKALDELGSKYTNGVTLISYNLDEQPGALARLKVPTVPALILYGRGRELARLSGVVSKAEIEQMLDKHLAGEG
jgi:thioredoxin 1